MKATVMGEVLLLVGLLAVAWLVYVQQEQLVALELELDRLKGGVDSMLLAGVPAAEDGAEAKPKARPKPKPKAEPEAQA